MITMVTRMPVQTLDAVKAELNRVKRVTKLAWWQIAQIPEFAGVTAGTLCAIAKGRDPKSPHIRELLRLPVYAPAIVCKVHGVVHVGKCPGHKDPRKNRIVVRKDNPASAAATIRAHMRREDIERLKELL